MRGGEIVGVAGVSGNGQRALADLLSGTWRDRRRIRLAGSPMRRAAPEEAQRLGLGRIPEDRMRTGLVTALTVAENMVLSRLKSRRSAGAAGSTPGRSAPWPRSAFAPSTSAVRGRTRESAMLSGGNLQKILLARELAHEPIVLLAAQPTRGLDIGATQFVHDRFLELRERGRAFS